ncbi:hypothetical protein D3C72_874510 [compost metagenome]
MHSGFVIEQIDLLVFCHDHAVGLDRRAFFLDDGLLVHHFVAFGKIVGKLGMVEDMQDGLRNFFFLCCDDQSVFDGLGQGELYIGTGFYIG